uniref:Uncharacterized protein n=1 Tax=Arundo donax TaxID=35708 RepID=A0A0A9EFF8_ARUDO
MPSSTRRRSQVTHRTRPAVYPPGRMAMAVATVAAAPAATLRRGRCRRTRGVVIPTHGLNSRLRIAMGAKGGRPLSRRIMVVGVVVWCGCMPRRF